MKSRPGLRSCLFCFGLLLGADLASQVDSLATTTRSQPFTVDLRHTYFSRRGSWLTLFPTEKPATLRFYFARMKEERGDWLDLTFLVGGRVRPVAFTAEPSHLSVWAGGAAAPRGRAYLVGEMDAVIDARGFDLAISSVKGGLDLAKARPAGSDTWTVQAEGWSLRLELLEGTAEDPKGDGWSLAARDGRLRVLFRMYRGHEPVPLRVDPDRDIAAIDRDWAAWRAKMPAVPAERMRLALGAWWNLWSLYAPKDTNFPTDAVLVAKAQMNSVWPWDHCFVALALGLADLPAAWDQFLIPFLNADAEGKLPDQMLPEDVYRGVTKPPIHGWTLLKLMERHRLPRARLEALYPRLVAWTEFWFQRRDDDGDGIPAYGGEHSGWESGWDNASVLGDPKARYETPDLQAYLVLQMKALARVARELGRVQEADRWQRRSHAHLKLLRERFWNGQAFVVQRVGSAVVDPKPTSLLCLMPLVLGRDLDKDIFDKLALDLETRFLTPYGPATEEPTSPCYVPDGYWRGPVWAPCAYLLADGLRRGGRPDLAREIARRFCDMVASSGGHYENYDSLTGQGLRCKGFAWTSAVDLLFMHEYILGDDPPRYPQINPKD